MLSEASPRGAIVFGDYLLLKRLGIGGMAEVFRAQRVDRRPGEPDLALKRLLPAFLEEPRIAQLFLREVEALRRIDHPAVIKLVDAGMIRDIPYVVMPWTDGVDLRRVLQANQPSGPQQPLPTEAALWLALQLAEGLDAAHQTGVIHRDVSPSNVLVDSQGRVLLIDFGIARVAGLAQTTHGQGLRGKWAYAAPEQVAGQPLGPQTDLFALGSVLVEALMGVAPFADPDRERTLAHIALADPLHWPSLPAHLGDLGLLCRALVARDPADRPATGRQVAAVLERVLLRLHDGDGLRARSQLRERVAGAQPYAEQAGVVPAELRGEDVTRPEDDRDATQVREHALTDTRGHSPEEQ